MPLQGPLGIDLLKNGINYSIAEIYYESKRGKICGREKREALAEGRY
jgi:hypothetical protein